MKSLDKAIAAIEDAGFGYIKVELEANFDRDTESDRECDECYGNGTQSCYNCDGEGAVDTGDTVGVNEQVVYAECDECYGSGEQSCEYCDDGRVSGDGAWSSEYDCEQYLLSRLSDEALEAIIYGNFYNDGSVDSEYTFTIPMSKAGLLPEFLNAFKDLGEEIGNGIDVDGAGMHITVIPTESGGRYPVRNFTMPRDNVRNFIRMNERLLPALFFLASSNSRSRGLGYRRPRISDDEKYSAIYTHGDTCFEYRLFETCYDKPEAIYDYIKVIANTLKFYANPELRVRRLGKQFGFSDGYELSRFFTTPEQLRILNAQIKELKPSDKTIKKLKEERKVPVTLTTVVEAQREKRKQLADEYKVLVQHNKEVKELPITPDLEIEIQRRMRYYEVTRAQAEMRARGIEDLPSLREFVTRRINNRFDTFITV